MAIVNFETLIGGFRVCRSDETGEFFRLQAPFSPLRLLFPPFQY